MDESVNRSFVAPISKKVTRLTQYAAQLKKNSGS